MGRPSLSMDLDDFTPRTPADPLAAVVGQELDRFSVDELRARIVVLEGEIARCRARIESAVNHLASVQGLFRR